MKKKFAIIFLTTLLTVATLFVFVACGEKPCEHNWSNATCTTAKTCTLCNETEGSALGHDWLAATCTTAKTCALCNETDGAALGHDCDEEIIYDATCTTTGSKELDCKNCSYWSREVIPALGHNWFAATCLAPKTCERCSETEGSVLEHTVVIDQAVPSTCTTTGLTEGKHCSVCNTVLVEQQVLPCHAYTETVSQKTCTENAKITYDCDNCDYYYDIEMEDISLSIKKIGYGSGYINGSFGYIHDFEITATGGYGEILFKYEVYSNSTDETPTIVRDFTNSVDFGLTSSSSSLGSAILKVTAKDSYNNVSVYRFKLSNSTLLSYEVVVPHEYKSEHDIVYLNTYGFDRYSCLSCLDVTYLDKNKNELELAELRLSNDKTVIIDCNNIDTAELLIIPETVTLLDDSSLFVSYKASLKYVLLNNNSVDISLQGSFIEQIFVPVGADVTLYHCDNLKTVIWQDGITTVGNNKYSYVNTGCDLEYSAIENIVIPASVTKIYSNVFKQCLQLSSVFYMGSEEDWGKITIESAGNVCLTDATRYYYSETQPVDSGNYWHYVDGVPTVWTVES